ncbi:DUF4175 family protein [Rhodocaloribacter sp.]
MSEQTSQLVERLRQRLRAAMRRMTLAEALFGLVLMLGIVSAYWVLSVALEAGFWFGGSVRAALFWTGALMATGLFVYFLLLPLMRLAGLMRGPSEERVARRIGARFPEVSDRLVNLLQLASGRHTEAPNALVDGAVQMLSRQVERVPFEQVEDFHRARRAARIAAWPVLALLVFLIAAPSTFLDASKRLLSPGATFERPAPFTFLVDPGSVELVKGASLEIAARTEGRTAPEEITLALNYLDEAPVETIDLRRDSTGVFRHTLVNVRRSLRYRVEAGRVRSPWHTVTIEERPIVRGLQVALEYPAYTRIPPQRLEPNVGDIAALPGTKVSLDVRFGGEQVTEAFLRFDDGSLDTLALETGRASGSFTLRREGNYQVLLRNDRGIENNAPITYEIKLVSDAYPAVVLLEPEPLTELNEDMRAALRLRIADDFGFVRLRLYYRLAESRFGQPDETFSHLDLPLDDRRLLDQEITYEWLLRQTTALDPVPGDVIEYYVAVWDNDAVAGYKSAKTPPHRLRMPSLAEQYENLSKTQDEAENTLEDLMREADTVKKQFEELRDELRRKPEADWEDQRQVEQLQERQRQMEQRVEDLASQIEEATARMEENNLVSEETLQKFEELQKVAEEINSPELMEALKQLQEAMQNLNLQQMQQAIENFQFNEEQYQERLERTLELFKKLRVEQGLEEISKRMEELAREEERLAEETGKLQERRAEDESPAEDERREGKEDETQEGENQEGENREGEKQEGENRQGKSREGEQNEGKQQEDGEQQSASDQESLAQEQERSAEEMKAIEERLEELKKQMEELRNAPKQEMEDLSRQMERQALPEEMKKNAEQLRNGELQPAQQGQQQMQQQLQQMQSRLQQMQQSMQGRQMQINIAGLRQALSDILTLSERQELLRGDVRGLSADSPLLRDYAHQQVELSEGLSTVVDSLQSLAREIPQMTREVQRHAGEALREMGSATEAMADRVARRASGHQKGAMTQLNELALLLSDLLNQMMNASSGSGGSMSMQQMIQQMQQMAGQQQQLNRQIQQLLNDMQGNRLTQDMQDRLRQLAGQQEQIRNQLRQLSRDRNLRNNVLGDLNRIAEQMEETIRELQRKRFNRKTVQRQQQILTRLLDATRSLQERGREKKRESRQGEDFTRPSPGELTPAEEAEKLRRDLLRALDSGYAPDYEELIKRYFELLQRKTRDRQE